MQYRFAKGTPEECIGFAISIIHVERFLLSVFSIVADAIKYFADIYNADLYTCTKQA